jgi:hypothetical protein
MSSRRDILEAWIVVASGSSIIDPDQRGWEYPDRGVRLGDNQEKDSLLALRVSTKS